MEIGLWPIVDAIAANAIGYGRMNTNQTIQAGRVQVAGITSSLVLPEGVFVGLLVSITAYLGISSIYLPDNAGAFVQQACVLMLFVVAVAARKVYQVYSWAKVIRCLLIFCLISFLYNALASLAFNNVPWISDGLLYAYDTVLGLECYSSSICTGCYTDSMANRVIVIELLSVYSLFIH